VPQNQVDFRFSVAPQNRRREVGVGHAFRFSGLLRMEASLVMIFQSGLKTSGGATAGGAHDKLKTDGSMRRTTSDPTILPLTFSMY
jgi:hypothetical protein